MKKLLFILAPFFANTNFALAQAEDLDAEGVVNVLNKLAQFAVDAAALLLVVSAGYYAIRIATAGGNADQFNDAKKGFIYSLIGALIIFGVNVIIDTVYRFIKGV